MLTDASHRSVENIESRGSHKPLTPVLSFSADVNLKTIF